MKKILLLAVVALAFTFQAVAQVSPAGPSFAAGVYQSQSYAAWQVPVAIGNPATGTGTITLKQGYAVLPDGTTFVPFSTNVPIIVGLGTSVQETVTPTAVSGCFVTFGSGNLGGGISTCQITASFANIHGVSEIITSGSNGIFDAVQDSANKGGGMVYWQVDCGNITLNTGGATTTTTCNVPNQFTSMGGSSIVKTTITTSASYSIGVTGATTQFINACTSLTAGTNCALFQTSPAIRAGSPTAPPATTAILITANAAAGAGVIHPRVWGYIMVQSSF